MGQRNIHSCRPTTIGGIVCLIVSYVPVLIALGIMLGIMGPFFRCYATAALKKHYPTHWMHWWWTWLSTLAACTLLLWSYAKCVLTPPGYVAVESVWQDPPTLAHRAPTAGSRNYHVVQQLARDGEARYCKLCNVYKPDDAHHCRDCGRCVLRMDHHCPWICNCVGISTEKFFLQFLVYISVTGGVMLANILYGMNEGLVFDDVVNSIFVVLVAIAAGTFAVVMLGFGGFHVWMLWRGMTTVDYVVAQRTGAPTSRTSSAASTSLGGQKRARVLDAVFGAERTWYHVVLPIDPVRRSGGSALQYVGMSDLSADHPLPQHSEAV